jgi:head-tail adaptor
MVATLTTLFKRNLAKCGQPITLQNRDIVAPDFDTPDFDLDFTNDQNVQGIISTKRGKTIFDGVATDQPITHRIAIEFLAGITAETWVLFNGRRLDIVDVENIGEQDECLVLLCTDRGTAEASKA